VWEGESSVARVKCLTFKVMFYLLHSVYPYISWPSSWIDLIKLIEGCRHELRVWKVNWERPPPNTFQLNTDGSALSNLGKIGGGGIFRDSQGDMIYAYTVSLGTGTNNLAERLTRSNLQNGSHTAANLPESCKSRSRTFIGSSTNLIFSSASTHLERLIVLQISSQKTVTTLMKLNIFTLTTNYLLQSKGAMSWKKWASPVAEERTTGHNAVCNTRARSSISEFITYPRLAHKIFEAKSRDSLTS
ncbi:hypothetical protein H5410_001707, partial [Solanum commersonii]